MSHYSTEPALDEDALVRVADLRARGNSWEATARGVGWEVDELRRAVRRESEFDALYQEAEREVRREAEAEMVLTFRGQMRDPDPVVARKGAEALAKVVAAERRERTRLEVERLRADTALAKLAAKRPVSEQEPTPPPHELSPEAVHRPDLEDLYARRAANDRAVVWLWGGAHKVGGVEPDAATDTPLVLFADDTVPGRRKVYWAARFPLPGDPFTGPFPAPAQEPTSELTPEQLRQLKSLTNGRDCAA